MSKSKNLYLGEYKRLLEEISRRTGRTVSSIVREAVREQFSEAEEREEDKK